MAGGERVSRWERGADQPRPELLVKMADVLDVGPRELIRLESSVPDLRALRLAAGLDAYEVARAIHLSLPTYRRWEQGRWRRLPTKGVIDALARTFKVPPADVTRALNAARLRRRQRTEVDTPIDLTGPSPPELTE